ncbi:purine nucleoside permease-domain-containing protein [Fusarium venenatum]|uniref:purine nucleoside permease-domain-containing protein n=1 Tax=Fusarium venenatum TaxID=56646 RepID=UPI001DD44222|nr:purine nucleoside permease-domain-containing protein [Fusarium venenatum]
MLLPIDFLPLVSALPHFLNRKDDAIIAPKVMIISMWSPEAEIWHDRLPGTHLGNLSAKVIHSPGLSMLFPCVTCTDNGDICHLTVGEGEVNSAASLMALVLSPKFDLSSTYFLIAGIAGVNPKYGTLGTVAIARYAVQVALQYEIDPRSLPPNFPTGYISYGRDQPHEYPFITYGTEVFELNAKLQETAHKLASKVELEDATGPKEYRALYGRMGESYRSASQPPSVVKCDTATSDVYYSGSRLSESFENTTRVWTNGTGVYCMTAQEDNAVLEVLVRAAIEKIVDFSRVMVIRTGSNFDRPPLGHSDLNHLTAQQNGFGIAIANIFNAGIEIVKGIVHDWDETFKDGITAENYVGDIFGSLGGEPDFGFGSLTLGKRIAKGCRTNDLAVREMDRRRILTQKSLRKV